MIPLDHVLFLAAFLFCVGMAIILTKRNIILILIGIELIFNAANINLVAFSRYDPQLIQGQVFALFVITIAAAEAALALAILIQVYRFYQTANLDEVSSLKG